MFIVIGKNSMIFNPSLRQIVRTHIQNINICASVMNKCQLKTAVGEQIVLFSLVRDQKYNDHRCDNPYLPIDMEV